MSTLRSHVFPLPSTTNITQISPTGRADFGLAQIVHHKSIGLVLIALQNVDPESAPKSTIIIYKHERH